MDLKTWGSYYNKIMEDFGFDKEKDFESAVILNEIIENTKNNILLDGVKNIIEGKEVYIFGAGPSLKNHVKIVKEIIKTKAKTKEMDLEDNYIIISADGATKALLEEGLIPDIIVSDLDGDMSSIFESNDKGSIVVVHAHGDNIDKIQKYAGKLKNIVGSTQVPKEFDYLINYGGFTDGDRCCFLAEEFGAKKIILCGMDFGIYTTKYSRPNLKNDVEVADDIKVKKLKYAEKFVNWLKEHGKCGIAYIDQ
jgi:hypothetical protein